MLSPLRLSLGLCLGLATFTLAAQSKPGVDPANLDSTVKPCEDFYAYANGGWLKSHSLPADKARFGAFEEGDYLGYSVNTLKLSQTSSAASRAASSRRWVISTPLAWTRPPSRSGASRP